VAGQELVEAFCNHQLLLDRIRLLLLLLFGLPLRAVAVQRPRF
jgi:hypothetical protein